MFLDCPGDVLYKIFYTPKISENNVVLCCKKFYSLADEKYKDLNSKGNYLVWDESELKIDLSERMIYFSNQIFREMLGRHRNLRCNAKDEKALRVYKHIKEDSYFLKENHIFKICGDLFYSQIGPLKEIPEVSNQQYSILNNFFSELSPEIPSQGLNASDEKINRPFLGLLVNNKEIMQLRSITLATESQLERILELDDYATRDDLMRFFSTTRSVEKMFKFCHPQFDKIRILKLAALSLEQRNLYQHSLEFRLRIFIISGNDEDKKNLLYKFNVLLNTPSSRGNLDYQKLHQFCVRCFEAGVIEAMQKFAPIFSEQKCFKEAVDCKERLIKLGEFVNYGDLALQYIELGMFEKAVECYEKCEDFRYGAIDAFEPLGKFHELLQYFRRTNLRRDNGAIIKELGLMADFCQRQGFYEEEKEFRERRERAIKSYEKCYVEDGREIEEKIEIGDDGVAYHMMTVRAIIKEEPTCIIS